MAGNEQALAPIQQGPGWTPADVALIKDTVAKGTNESEFKLFLYAAQKYGLDPLVKQIWCVKYGTAPANIFTGRDGFLAIAHRSGQFDGMESGCRLDGDEVIGWCKVYRRDMQRPFAVEVPLSEYSTGQNLWKTKPKTMIQKVAESQALRRAFDISGLYAPEEFDQGAQVQVQMHESKPSAEMTVDFGKYAGKTVREIAAVNRSYVEWLAANAKTESIREAAKAAIVSTPAEVVEVDPAGMFGGVEAKPE